MLTVKHAEQQHPDGAVTVQVAPRMLADSEVSSGRQRKLCHPSLAVCLAFSDGSKKELERRVLVPIGCLQGYDRCFLAEAHVRQPQHLLILRHGLRAVCKVLCSAAQNSLGHTNRFCSKNKSWQVCFCTLANAELISYEV